MNKHGGVQSSGYWLAVYTTVYVAILYLPVALLPIFSFNDSSYIAFPFKGFTLRWYELLSDKPELIDALTNSLILAGAVAFVSTALGTLFAKGLTSYRIRARNIIIALISLPILLPGILLGVSLLGLLKSAGYPLDLLSVGIGHTLICLPFAAMVMLSRLEGFDPSLEEASADLGENAIATFFRVTLPLNAPGIVASMLLTFTISFDEFILAFFLGGTNATLPVYIWGQLRFPNELPSVLALGSIVIVLSLITVCLAQWLRTMNAPNPLPYGR